jgi:hypothetical protein
MPGNTYYYDQMFNYQTASTTLTQMYPNATAAQGTYAPQLVGTLVRVDILITPQAATSLAQQGRVELNCPIWAPNTMRIPFAGFGLATAPQAIGGNELGFSLGLNLTVNPQQPITGNVIYYFSPVTPNIVVSGLFQ